MGYGLVLEGGGSKGAYQVGAYLALVEMGFEFDVIVGTSIGAFNGAMFAQGDVYECFKAWRNMEMKNFETELRDAENDDVFSKIKDKLTSMDIKVPEIVKSPSPLFQLVDRYIDEDKIRASSIDFGVCTFNLTDFKAEKLFTDDIEQGQLKDYVIASCYLPAFKLKPLHGKFYLDGCFASKAPIEMLDGRDLDIVVIRLHNEKGEDFSKAKYVVEPHKALGKTLDFSPERSEELIKIGYFDAFKTVKGLRGDDYYIMPIDVEETVKYIYKIIKYRTKGIESKIMRAVIEEYVPKIAKELKLSETFNYDDLLYKLLEHEAIKKDIDRFKVYTVEELTREILNGI